MNAERWIRHLGLRPHPEGESLQAVAPGFDFEDFEMIGRQEARRRWPDHREIVERLTPAAS